MGTLFKFPMLPTHTFMANPIAIGEAELRWVAGWGGQQQAGVKLGAAHRRDPTA
jgi:hypothetical protein